MKSTRAQSTRAQERRKRLAQFHVHLKAVKAHQAAIEAALEKKRQHDEENNGNDEDSDAAKAKQSSAKKARLADDQPAPKRKPKRHLKSPTRPLDATSLEEYVQGSPKRSVLKWLKSIEPGNAEGGPRDDEDKSKIHYPDHLPDNGLIAG